MKMRTLGSLKKHFQNLQDDTNSKGWSKSKAKKNVQYYFNCENPPILYREEDEDVLVIDLLPPPYLHCVLLGPFNAVWKVLRTEAPVSIKKFEVKYNMKPDGQGVEFSGKPIKKIIHSKVILEELTSILDEEQWPLISCLRQIGEVHNICRNRELNSSYKQVLYNFTDTWDQCWQAFGLSKTLKIHIISDHLESYFTRTGKTLLQETDETTGSGHQSYSKFEKTHGMVVNTVGSPSYNRMQHRRIVAWNSLNAY